MNFYGGIKSKDYFPWSDDVYALKYLSTQGPNTNLKLLVKENYGKTDTGSIRHDLSVLNEMDTHARETNDFYNGGKMEYYMNKWITLTQRIRDDKAEVDISDIISKIVDYNDNLEARKRDYCAYQLKQCCYDFNRAYHEKKAGYWHEYTKTYNGVQYKYKEWIDPVYYVVRGFQNYDGKNVEKIVDIIKAMESESGISFLSPKDWKSKISRTNG